MRLQEWVKWFGLRRIVTSAVASSVLAIGAWWVVRVPPVPVESAIAFTSTTVGMLAPVASGKIVVHVAGEVNAPGVYSLGAGARMIDALQAAGGPTQQADLEVINLATPLADSIQIYVPSRKASRQPTFRRPQPGVNVAPSTNQSIQESGVININRATATELEQLPGVGPATARAIIDYRTANGPFSSPEGLLEVKGIGPAKFASMRAQVGV